MYRYLRDVIHPNVIRSVGQVVESVHNRIFISLSNDNTKNSVYKGRYGSSGRQQSITISQFLEHSRGRPEKAEDLVPAGPADTTQGFILHDFLRELRNIPFLMGAKGGVPRRKGSLQRQKGRHSGMHFKWMHLRLTPWYVCPLCGEPKQAEQVCRKEICRRVRP